MTFVADPIEMSRPVIIPLPTRADLRAYIAAIETADWPRDRDLQLVQALMRGDRLHVIAAKLGVTTDEAKARWYRLTRKIARMGWNARHVSIAGQDLLVSVLRGVS